MRWNAVAGVLWLLVGGITALLVILTRWPAIKLLPADQFYLILTAHGIDMLILWILFFEMAVLYFASSTLLRCRMATPKIAWLGFWLMVVGGIMTNVAIFQGESSVMFTSYMPMQAPRTSTSASSSSPSARCSAPRCSSAPWSSPRRTRPIRARCRWSPSAP
jgi:cytochrome c oxidase subunit 1